MKSEEINSFSDLIEFVKDRFKKRGVTVRSFTHRMTYLNQVKNLRQTTANTVLKDKLETK